MPAAPTQSKTNIRWLLVFWLFVLSAVSFLDRSNISVAGPSIASDFHLSNIQLGFVFSAFLFGYALFQAPGGWLSDKLGPRRVLALGVMWWGVFTALTAVVKPTFPNALLLFIAIRFLLGAGEAIIYPASNQFVSRWIPVESRGIANGLIFAGVGVGAGISPPLIVALIARYGWRVSFYACALIGLAAGAIWYLAARDTPAEHPSVSPEELQLIEAGVADGQSAGAKHLLPWSSIFFSRSVLAVSTSYFCFGYVAWIFFSWFFIYLKTVRGLDLKSSALYGMLPYIAMAICCPIGGVINDQISRISGKRAGRCGLGAFAMAATAVFLFVGSRADNARIASLILAGGAGALYLAQSSFWSVTGDIAGASSGSVSGVMNMGAQLGGMVTASLTPYIASLYGWTASFLVAAVLALIGAGAWMLVDPDTKLSAEAP
jgi:ACS family glucarate transporter-like MFS transporter